LAAAVELENEQSLDMNFAQITLVNKGEMKSDYVCQPVCIFYFTKNNSINFRASKGRKKIGEEAKQAE
jgi:hypothetical protein